MKRWIAVPIAVGLCASVTGCRLERSDETMREDRAEIAEERRRTREEIIEDYRDLMERIRSLPPEERMRLHEEMHRDMMRHMEGTHRHEGGPPDDGARPHHPPGATSDSTP